MGTAAAAKAKAATTAQNTNKKTNVKKQFNTDLAGANPDLLKSTNLLDKANEALGNKPGFKKRIDLEKLGPMVFKSWVKFFKYKDQSESDKKAKQRFNSNKK